MAALKLSILDQAPVATGSSPAQALRNAIDLAQLADRLGYERYWVAEHHGMEIIATSAPEVLIAAIAQATVRIRVGAGAVLLPHYSAYKVAEVFRTLHALYPGRIDLGIGRGPGAGPAEIAALVRHRANARFTLEDFPEQLLELRAFLEGGFPPDHPLNRVRVQPATEDAPPIWLVGSTPWGSGGAGALGLPYAFAHFIGPRHTRAAIASYRHAFRPHGSLARPLALIAIGVLCAPTDAEADALAASARAVAGRPNPAEGRLPSVEEAQREIATRPVALEAAAPVSTAEWPRTFVGSPATLRARLGEFAAQHEVGEIMAITSTHDHGARRRSYELLAQAFQLRP